jgi:hypothetical protein
MISGGCWGEDKFSNFMSKEPQTTHLQICVHDHQTRPPSNLESSQNSAGKPILAYSHQELDVVTLFLQPSHFLDRTIPRIVVDNDELRLLWVRDGSEDPLGQWANVGSLVVGGHYDRVENGCRGRLLRWMVRGGGERRVEGAARRAEEEPA